MLTTIFSGGIRTFQEVPTVVPLSGKIKTMAVSGHALTETGRRIDFVGLEATAQLAGNHSGVARIDLGATLRSLPILLRHHCAATRPRVNRARGMKAKRRSSLPLPSDSR
jgi:hypothetical protein